LGFTNPFYFKMLIVRKMKLETFQNY